MRVEEFKSPGKEYRPSPFWSWNDRLEPDELRRQVRDFADKGFGGYFMHSRVGLATPYLSKEWMECIRACLEEGKKVGLESWLYDEDKWPSGFAGGLVPAKGDEYRARSLIMEEIKGEEVEEALVNPEVLGVFEVRFVSPRIIKSFRRLKEAPKPGVPSDERKFLVFKVKVDERSNWFNGESYVDLLNPSVTEEFLKVTHDAYAKEFRADFGEFMPGIFTDEPNYVGGNLIPWTPEMAEYFRSVNGYDILEKLPLLYFEGEGSFKVRYDFWRTVTRRFLEAFTEPYSKRCGALGLKMTGHYLAEDNLISQIRVIGAAMPHYEHMHCPGIDHLNRNIENPLTLKQCSSVAHQFGRRRVLSELFGCSGHSMTFEDQKWIADFHFALGITFLCPHLTLYTMKGDAKRDYPPTFSYHQPYWPYFKLINDYFARASYVCSQGRFYADLLLLHPISSAWATYSPISSKEPNCPPKKYNDSFVELMEDLLALHWDFDLGDEMIMERHARVEGTDLILGEMHYKVIVVPPSLNWAGKTYDLLSRFLDAGGHVVFVGERPSLIEGRSAENEWDRLVSHPNAMHVDAEAGAVAEALKSLLPKPVRVVDEEGQEIGDIYVHHRVDGSCHIYFLSNKSREQSYDAKIIFSEVGDVKEWNLFDGSILPAEAVTEGGKTVIYAKFHPAESHVYVIDKRGPKASEGPFQKPTFSERVIKLPKTWRFERSHPNSLVLDKCQYSTDGTNWSEVMPIWKVRREVWKEAGLEEYIGIQPWALISKGVKPKRRFRLYIRTRFKSKVEGKRVYLVVEKAALWRLSVNGVPVSTSTSEWQWDRQFGKIDISQHVRVGENLIVLSCRYDIDVPVEDLYLVGDFGVEKASETEYILADEPETLRDGDWTTQGYPFYSGTIRYRGKFRLEELGDRVLVRLPDARGSLFTVSVNGGNPIPICWSPLEADVTSQVQKGENTVTIEVVGTLRNTFGPLHHKKGDLTSVGPRSFVDEANWTDSYQIVPYGLINGAEVVVLKKASK